MKRLMKNESGAFLLFELIVLAIVLLATGYAFYQYNANKNKVAQATAPKPHIVAKPSLSASPSPYAGWQTYCSDTGGICFKYPQNWTEAQSGQEPYITLTVTSPSKAVQVIYDPALQGIGGSCPLTDCLFDPESITPLSSSNTLGLEIIKGVFTNKGDGPIFYLPNYFLSGSSQMSRYDLQLNQTVGVGFFASWFSSPVSSSGIENLYVQANPNVGFSSITEVNNWLAQPEVATSGQILGSTYVKN